MKFLCIECDRVMGFEERQLPGDGTFSAVFACPGCGREIAMLANPMETQLVSSLGVRIGGRELPPEPMELTRESMRAGAGQLDDAAPLTALQDIADEASTEELDRGGVQQQRVVWDDDARARLEHVPSFVRGMVKRIYTDWAREREIWTITPEVMDTARSDLGLEGM